MKLSIPETNRESLGRLAAEAVALVESRDFETLVARFGYALAYDRNPTLAFKEDFERCLTEAGNSSNRRLASIEVKYFKPSDTRLHAVVECVVPVSPTAAVLVELIVSGDGDERHICLEDVSCLN
jgi:hypothetical protein